MSRILCLVFIFFTFALEAKTYPMSDHYDGKRFYNPEKNQLHSFWEILKWKFSGSAAEWPKHVANKAWPLLKPDPLHKAIVTFINHASFLFQLPGLTVLTDPIFSDRASPFRFMGPKRVREPGIQLQELPQIDVVVISHNHYDHLDLESLKQLDGRFHPLFLVPLGDEKLLKEAGIQNVQELDWWQEVQVKDHTITFVPAQHWSARSLFDKCESLWGGYFIRHKDSKIFFAGDTGYGPHFKDIKTRLGNPTLALLPIGAYDPAYIMAVNHLNPLEAVKAHLDLAAEKSIGMHFGTFQLTDEPWDEPEKKLIKAREELGVAGDAFFVLDVGESRAF